MRGVHVPFEAATERLVELDKATDKPDGGLQGVARSWKRASPDLRRSRDASPVRVIEQSLQAITERR